MICISPYPFPLRTQYAIRPPSGDHAGFDPSTSRLGFAPVASRTKISLLGIGKPPPLTSNASFFTLYFDACCGSWQFAGSQTAIVKKAATTSVENHLFIRALSHDSNDVIRWDENAGLRRDAISSQVIDALEAQGDKGDRQ
jgi:hypothetical protein